MYGQSEEGLAHEADDVLKLVLPHDLLHHIAGRHECVVCAMNQKAGGSNRLRIIGTEHIASDLQPRKLIERQVAIERVDHPIAIGPGVGPHAVVLEAVALAEMCNI